MYDVSIVDTPAYEQTSIYARSLEAMDLELKTMELEETNKKKLLVRTKLNLKIKIGEYDHEFRKKK